MEKMEKISIFFIMFFSAVVGLTSSVENKYTKEANVNFGKGNDNKPFRMSKINLVWEKAQQKLIESKLKTLFSDLQLQDKEEIQLKRIKSEGGDKAGLKEAEVRRRFKGILNTYGLLEYFDEGGAPVRNTKDHAKNDNHVNKYLFKDKKLNKLWEKAEKGGFTQDELKTLKEEFTHHQDRIDEYYALLETLNQNDKNALNNEVYSSINLLEESDNILPHHKNSNSSLNDFRTKHRELKDGYDILHKKAASGPTSVDFSEPRVQNLWKMALKGDFSADELASLQTELKHYEKRIEKLNFLQGELHVKSEVNKKEIHTNKDVSSFYEDKIKRQERQVEKLHNELESKILGRHNEL